MFADPAETVTDALSCLKPTSYPSGIFDVGFLHGALDVHAR